MEEDHELTPRYQRVLLKLSGEALMGSQGYGVDPRMADRIADEIEEIHETRRPGGGHGRAAATSFAELRSAPPAWTGSAATTWECWPP